MDDLWALAIRASEELNAGRPAKALPLLERCARGGEGWALLLRARAKQELGRERLAIADVTRAFERDLEAGWVFGLPVLSPAAPAGAEAARLRRLNAGFGASRGAFAVRAFVGKLKLMAGDGSGLADLEWALRARPDQAYLHAWRAQARRRLGDAAGALKDAEAALRLDPKHSLAYVTRAALRRAEGRFEDALDDAARAARLRSDDEMAPLEAAKACLRLGRGPAALEWLARAVRLCSRLGWRDLYDRGQDILADFGQFGEDAVGQAWRGEALLSLGRLEEAAEVLGDALKRAPRFGWAWLWLAQARRGDAMRSAGRALALAPKYARAWVFRGTLLLQEGDPRRALSDFSKALALEPRWAEALHRRAQALAALDRREDARRDCRAALRLDPRFADARALDASLGAGA